ncbi:MAG TPA: hypothetical protein DDY16_00925 [Tenacibaculum sp.]|nr:hypothetical protein [Tenacibaculum sp.]
MGFARRGWIVIYIWRYLANPIQLWFGAGTAYLDHPWGVFWNRAQSFGNLAKINHRLALKGFWKIH